MIIPYRLGEESEGGFAPPSSAALLRGRAFLIAVGHAPDRAVVVVRNQHRAILGEQHVGRAADVVVVRSKEAADEHLRTLHSAVLVQEYREDVAPELLGAIPR